MTSHRPELQVSAHPAGDGPLPPADISFVETGRGRFRVLHWPGQGTPVLLLHGLSGVAEVWGPLVDAFGEARRPLYAFDQRGHGQSLSSGGGYTAGDFVADTLAVSSALGLQRPHVAGHSMGGRVVFSMGARPGTWFRSAAVLDIGPEAWQDNWVSTLDAFERIPRRFASETEALEYAARGRELGDVARAVFLSRLRSHEDGSLSWWADWDALAETVRNHRSHNFWRQWDRLPAPALLVHGENSNELRSHVAGEMRRRNPAVEYHEVAGVGHNLPMQAPGELSGVLEQFWQAADHPGS